MNNYVGLPLAVALSRHFKVVGIDISERRIAELNAGIDRTKEVDLKNIAASSDIEYTTDLSTISSVGLIIIAVPTPIDEHRTPDLTAITEACRSVGKYLGQGTTIVFESTVFPGLTEGICVPILEEESNLECGKDFWVGYSPERINPGDKVHRLETITKIVAGQDLPTGELLQKVYGAIIDAGTYLAKDIQTAEAAKVIENTQRDLNIAFMNELAMIFDRMGIDTLDVLEAAGTKWNFLPFRPGLVGGHCIGVDPYYLTFQAEAIGFHPHTILAGRQINDSMGRFIAKSTVKKLIKQDTRIKGARIGVLGLTFKENVPDIRNTKVVDIIDELKDFGAEVLVHDPMADPEEAEQKLGINLKNMELFEKLDAVILAVPHDEYRNIQLEKVKNWFTSSDKALVIDIKGFFDRQELHDAGISYWRL